MEADFIQVETPDHITIFDSTDAVVARFSKTKHGRWAYHSFTYGVSAKGMTLYCRNADQYLIGSVGQLMGEVA